MGQNTIIETRGAPLYINSRLLEGQVNTNVPGGTSQRFPVGDVLDEVRRFVNDIPDSGTATVTLNFNPADPLHAALLEWQKDNTILKFEWWISGERKNGVNTKTAISIGTVEIVTVATPQSGEPGGKLKYTDGSFSADIPRVGDHLEHASNDNLKVVAANYAESNSIWVTQADDSAVDTAVTTKATYNIKRPAQQVIFSGQISGLPTGGDRVLVATIQVNIIGTVEYKVGTPSIA